MLLLGLGEIVSTYVAAQTLQWVWPKLVCEVAYAEWTLDGELRQTTFLGWRDDKSPEEVVFELAKPTPQ
jgi:ATP-dependent DNA ligase